MQGMHEHFLGRPRFEDGFVEGRQIVNLTVPKGEYNVGDTYDVSSGQDGVVVSKRDTSNISAAEIISVSLPSHIEYDTHHDVGGQYEELVATSVTSAGRDAISAEQSMNRLKERMEEFQEFKEETELTELHVSTRSLLYETIEDHYHGLDSVTIDGVQFDFIDPVIIISGPGVDDKIKKDEFMEYLQPNGAFSSMLGVDSVRRSELDTSYKPGEFVHVEDFNMDGDAIEMEAIQTAARDRLEEQFKGQSYLPSGDDS